MCSEGGSLAECGSDPRLQGLTCVPQHPGRSPTGGHIQEVCLAKLEGVTLGSANESYGDVADSDSMGLGHGL